MRLPDEFAPDRMADLLGDDGVVTTLLPFDPVDVSQKVGPTLEVALPDPDDHAAADQSYAVRNLFRTATLLAPVVPFDTDEVVPDDEARRWSLSDLQRPHHVARVTLSELLEAADRPWVTHLADPTTTVLRKPEDAFYRTTDSDKVFAGVWAATDRQQREQWAEVWRDAASRELAAVSLDSNGWTWWPKEAAVWFWPRLFDVDIADGWADQPGLWDRPANVLPWAAAGFGPDEAAPWLRLLDHLAPPGRGRAGMQRSASVAPPQRLYWSAGQAARFAVDRGWSVHTAGRFTARTGVRNATVHGALPDDLDDLLLLQARASLVEDLGLGVGDAEARANCGFVGPDADAMVQPLVDGAVSPDDAGWWAWREPWEVGRWPLRLTADAVIGWVATLHDSGVEWSDELVDAVVAASDLWGMSSDDPHVDDLLRCRPAHVVAVAQSADTHGWTPSCLPYLAVLGDHHGVLWRIGGTDQPHLFDALAKMVETGDDPDALRAVVGLARPTTKDELTGAFTPMELATVC